MTPRKTIDQISSDDLDQLYDQLDQLRAVARGYCPACGRGDAAPTVTDWEQQKQRADEAEAKVAEYESTINWMTTCTSCARVLDSGIRETERADRAENAIRHARSLHRENCPVAQRKVNPVAFTCGMCDALGVFTKARDESARTTPNNPLAGGTATQATDGMAS